MAYYPCRGSLRAVLSRDILNDYLIKRILVVPSYESSDGKEDTGKSSVLGTPHALASGGVAGVWGRPIRSDLARTRNTVTEPANASRRSTCAAADPPLPQRESDLPSITGPPRVVRTAATRLATATDSSASASGETTPTTAAGTSRSWSTVRASNCWSIYRNYLYAHAKAA